MLLALDKDKELHLFAAIEDAEGWMEAIDIENGEYEFCDDLGQRYLGEITSPVTAFRAGEFILRPDGSPDPALLRVLLSKASRVGTACGHIKTLHQLKTRIEQSLGSVGESGVGS